MILITNREESATLVLHMSIMRADFRSLLKRQYKGKKGEYLKAYDYVKKECEDHLKDELEHFKELHLNIVDLEVLTAFISAYLDKLKSVLAEAKADDTDAQVFILTNVQKRCWDLLAA